MSQSFAHSRREVLLFANLFLCEGSIAGILLSLRICGERPWGVFLSSSPGLVFLCALAVFAISITGICYRVLEHRRSPSASFRLVVGMNLVTIVLILLTGEIMVRAGVRNSLQFETVGSTVLKPKSWEATKARYHALLDQAKG